MSRETPVSWARNYNFPAVDRGEITKAVFDTSTPAGMYGFVFNTRRPKFQNVAMRKALAMLFDFEWVNRSLFNNAYERTESYFENSVLSSIGKPASERERELLGPYLDDVEKSVLKGTYRASQTDGSGRDRKVQRAALNLFEGCRLLDQPGQTARPQWFSGCLRSHDAE